MVPDRHRVEGAPRAWTPAVAWTLAGLFVVLFGVILWIDARVYATYFPELGSLEWLGLHGVWLGPFVVFAVVGAVIASRRPRHPIGWLLLASALASVVGEVMRWSAALEVGTSPADPSMLALWAAPPSAPITVTGLALGVVVVPVLFPSGRLVSRRWRPVIWLAGLMSVAFLLNNVMSPRIRHTMVLAERGQVELYDVANPLAPPRLQDAAAAVPTGAATVLLPVLVVLAGAAVVVRFRGSEGVERQQMKWFVYAAGLVAAAAITQAVLAIFSDTTAFEPLALALLMGGLSAYPIAIGIAVLRYRLYEIDRIISRTVSYGLVLAILAGVYVAGVLGFGAAMSAVTGQQDSDLVVALSTLAAAGLFQPVRRRVQTAVDRRFNRTGYEAHQAVDAFAREVRDEVDLERIRRRIADTAATAVQPTHASIWFPDERERSP